MPRLAEKVAIVTGAGSGLGEAIARVLAAEGAHIVAANRSEETGKLLVRTIGEQGGKATFVQTDVASERDVRRLVDAASAISGGIDIIVNNAGSGVDIISPFWAVTSDAWDRAFAVNVRGMFLVAKYAYPHIPDGGSIINMGSVASVVGYPDETTYIATKGAVLQMTRGMACDLAARNIRVNCICPGPCYTPPMISWIEEAVDPAALELEWKQSIMLGRLGQPEEIATAVLFLASADSSFMTGESLIVDGGFTSLRPGSGSASLGRESSQPLPG
jgi:NAD(P)-dependent dehydrogenase (short-subunit alcohol dehydrogenase family)